MSSHLAKTAHDERRLQRALRLVAQQGQRKSAEPTWLRIPAAAGELLWKGAGHKYLKRVPYTDAKGRRRYRYYYAVQHGGGIARKEDIDVGASYRYGRGHYQVIERDGENITIRHDETGKTVTVTRAEFASTLLGEHGTAIAAHAAKLRRDIESARKHGTKKQVARLETLAERLDVTTARPETMVSWGWSSATQDRYHPAEVGDLVKRKGAIYVVLSTHSRYYREDGLSFGLGSDSGWLHTADVRPADAEETAHYQAEVEKTEAPRRALEATEKESRDAAAALSKLPGWESFGVLAPKGAALVIQDVPTVGGKLALHRDDDKYYVSVHGYDMDFNATFPRTEGNDKAVEQLKAASEAVGSAQQAVKKSGTPDLRSPKMAEVRAAAKKLEADKTKAKAAETKRAAEVQKPKADATATSEQLRTAGFFANRYPGWSSKSSNKVAAGEGFTRKEAGYYAVYTAAEAHAEALAADERRAARDEERKAKDEAAKQDPNAAHKQEPEKKASTEQLRAARFSANKYPGRWEGVYVPAGEGFTRKDGNKYVVYTARAAHDIARAMHPDKADQRATKKQADNAAGSPGTHPHLEKQGRRWVVTHPRSYDLKDRIHAAGAKWDPDKRHWYTGSKAVAEKLTRILKAGRPGVFESLAKAAVRASHQVPWSTRQVIVGPPPKPNRKEYPFVGTIDFQGLDIDVENRKGDVRRGTDGEGEKWAIRMRAHYGEIRGTEGADGDKLDVYVGPFADSPLVVVVHQQDPTTRAYDEDKVMLGFRTTADALSLYRRQYDRPGFYGGHITMPIGQFWRWVKDTSNRGKKVTHKAVLLSAGSLRLAGLAPLAKAPAGGWQPIPGSNHGGYRKRNGDHWDYWYPSGQHSARAAADHAKQEEATRKQLGRLLRKRGASQEQLSALLDRHAHHAAQAEAAALHSKHVEKITQEASVTAPGADLKSAPKGAEGKAGEETEGQKKEAEGAGEDRGADGGDDAAAGQAKTLAELMQSAPVQQAIQDAVGQALAGTGSKKTAEGAPQAAGKGAAAAAKERSPKQAKLEQEAAAAEKKAAAAEKKSAAANRQVAKLKRQAAKKAGDPWYGYTKPTTREMKDKALSDAALARVKEHKETIQEAWTAVIEEHRGLAAKALVWLPTTYAVMMKAAGHRYIKRVPYTDGQGRRRYRYYYEVQHGRGVHHEEHFVVGAAFRAKGGHYHIESVKNGTITIVHDETGKRHEVTKSSLKHLLLSEHDAKLKAHRDQLRADLAEARRHGSKKQVERLEAEARRFGVPNWTEASVSVSASVGAEAQKPKADATALDDASAAYADATNYAYASTRAATAAIRDANAAFGVARQWDGVTGADADAARARAWDAADRADEARATAADAKRAARDAHRAWSAARDEERKAKDEAAKQDPNDSQDEQLQAAYGFTDEEMEAVKKTAANLQRLGLAKTPEAALERSAAGHADRLGKKKKKAEPGGRKSPKPAPKPAPEPAPSAGEDKATDKRVDAAKERATREIEDLSKPVVHEEAGEHVFGARRDVAAAGSRRDELVSKKRVSKAEVFGEFTIHDHVASGGTVGGWHAKNWLVGRIAATVKTDQVQDYLEATTVVAKTLDRCRTVEDVKTAVDELGDWGRRLVYGRDTASPGPEYEKRGTFWDWRGSGTIYERPEVTRQKAVLGKGFARVLGGASSGFGKALREGRGMEQRGTDAEAYIRSHARKNGFTLAEARTVQEPKRVGGPAVTGVTTGRITGQAVLEHFGLKNLDYGNWATNDERDLHLRGAAGALADLGDILGVPAASVGGGKLAIGFGSRGRGGKGAAVAHYETGRAVINLTKFRGGGSLAHEWGHFLDNQLAGGGSSSDKKGEHYASIQPSKLPAKSGQAMEELQQTVRGSQFFADARALDAGKKRAYWSSREEMFARLFESWAQDELRSRGRENTYLVHGAKGEGHATGIMATRSFSDHPDVAAAQAKVEPAEKQFRATLAQAVAEVSPKAKPAMTWWGWSDAVVEKVLRRHEGAKAAHDAYWEARRAPGRLAAGLAKDAGPREAQPYPTGDERTALLGKVAKLVGALRADGLLAKFVKAFVRSMSTPAHQPRQPHGGPMSNFFRKAALAARPRIAPLTKGAYEDAVVEAVLNGCVDGEAGPGVIGDSVDPLTSPEVRDSVAQRAADRTISRLANIHDDGESNGMKALRAYLKDHGGSDGLRARARTAVDRLWKERQQSRSTSGSLEQFAAKALVGYETAQ